ncbi:MAG: hypothetical protein K9K39_09515 [Desulfohalobiaceae bacterium]|nr:hypothetical protein [Desulfohalobiaceae bacterium]
MQSFEALIQEVQNAGLCHRCGGCVNFCTAVHCGALEQDSTGLPRFSDKEKCLECGIFYMICPETGELEEELGPLRRIASRMHHPPGCLGRALALRLPPSPG